jgi:hypothetical protein
MLCCARRSRRARTAPQRHGRPLLHNASAARHAPGQSTHGRAHRPMPTLPGRHQSLSRLDGARSQRPTSLALLVSELRSQRSHRCCIARPCSSTRTTPYYPAPSCSALPLTHPLLSPVVRTHRAVGAWLADGCRQSRSARLSGVAWRESGDRRSPSARLRAP